MVVGHEMSVMGVEYRASTRTELPLEWLCLTFETGPPTEVHWLVSDSPGSACPNLPGSRDTDSLCLLQLFHVGAVDPGLGSQAL